MLNHVEHRNRKNKKKAEDCLKKKKKNYNLSYMSHTQRLFQTSGTRGICQYYKNYDCPTTTNETQHNCATWKLPIAVFSRRVRFQQLFQASSLALQDAGLLLPRLLLAGSHQALDRGLASQLPARGTKKGMLRPATWHQPNAHSATLCIAGLPRSWAGGSETPQNMRLQENSPERQNSGAVYWQIIAAKHCC